MSDASATRSKIFITIVGIVSGIAFQLNQVSGFDIQTTKTQLLLYILSGALGGPLVFWTMSTVISKCFDVLSISSSFTKRFTILSRYSFVVFLIFLLGAQGLVFGKLYITAIALVWILTQLLIVIYVVESKAHKGTPKLLRWITALFLVSGFAALIYQVVWQRVLFTALGVNMESITLIVSIFMFGLGIGSFVGGKLSIRFPDNLPLLFVICEVMIGIFGLASIPLINYVSSIVVNSPIFFIATAVYFLLMIPTLLMGATLPILVKFLHQQYDHVGQSIGNLYWINTIGSAIACFLTVNVLFRIGGLQSSVWFAAALNIAIGGFVYYFTRKELSLVDGDTR